MYRCYRFCFLYRCYRFFFNSNRLGLWLIFWGNLNYVSSIKVLKSKSSKNIINDRVAHFNVFMPFNHPPWLKSLKCKCVYKLFKRHSILKALRYSYSKTTQNSFQGCSFFSNIYKHFTQCSIRVFPSSQVDFMSCNSSFLSPSFSSLRQ